MIVATVSHQELECSLSLHAELSDFDTGTSEDPAHANVQDVVTKDSPRHVLPSSLLIKSSDIRILDIIGQGRRDMYLASQYPMHTCMYRILPKISSPHPFFSSRHGPDWGGAYFQRSC